MKEKIIKLTQDPKFVVRTIRRMAKDESDSIGFRATKALQDWNPDGIPMSVVWHCLENAMLTHGPVAEADINLFCNVRDTYAGITIELSLSIEYINDKPFITVLHAEQFVEE